jgi:hypothetical protein
MVEIPLWTLPVAFLVCCWIPDSARLIRKKLHARRSETRRLRALDRLWADDEVGVASRAARLAGRDSLRTSATPTFSWPRDAA